ncbi:hypothetical protein [Nostoc sp. LPT]|uniref:hypothetical protein n=1 Tax=Nostoc sp. LPT TaxID=2815387 RepID=UPI002600894B|nr:hypothetical protein [Nostoc sp. LPT]
MNMVDGSTLLTTIYVLVDDWYQQKGYRYVPLLPGPSPRFTDSEMKTKVSGNGFFPIPRRTAVFRVFQGKLLEPISETVRPKQFNRPARRLEGMLEELRRFWV